MAAATNQHHASAAAPLPVAGRRVPQEWIDYNGHMNESRYLQAFSEAGDVFLAMIGADPNYVAHGHSFFTAETHLRHLRELMADAGFSITLQILGADEKRVHLWQEMHRAADGVIAATCEQMLLHVDMAAGRACAVLPAVRARLDPIVAAHAALARPAAAGRAIRLDRPRE